MQADIATEMLDDLAAGLLPRSEQLVDDPVGVDDVCALVPEDPGHEAFPAGNAAGEPDEEHETTPIQ